MKDNTTTNAKLEKGHRYTFANKKPEFTHFIYLARTDAETEVQRTIERDDIKFMKSQGGRWFMRNQSTGTWSPILSHLLHRIKTNTGKPLPADGKL